MIDKQLIESATNIRNEFLKLSSQLDDYSEDVRSLAKFLEKKIVDLTKYNEEVIKKPTVNKTIDGVTQHLVKEIESIELEEQKLRRKIEKINSRLEILQNDENVLYETIKRRYPDLSDEEIKKEIIKNLER